MVVQKSMPVQLPQATTAKIDLERKVPITITNTGQIYVESQAVSLEGMIRYLQAEKVKGGDIVVILRGDAKVEYGSFVTVLDTLKQMGIVKISIATDSK